MHRGEEKSFGISCRKKWVQPVWIRRRFTVCTRVKKEHPPVNMLQNIMYSMFQESR